MKKICFVVHEFGMFSGRGGIASYIYYLCKAILEKKNDEYELHVITPMYDKECELIKDRNFILHGIEPRSVEWQGSEICNLLKEIKPQWVETSDYEGLCLEAIIERNKGAEELKDTAFMVIHHTATKECFEWSYAIAFRNANIAMQNIYVRELAQYFLCDKNIFPSDFLLKYIQKNDGVKNGVLLRYTYEGKRLSKEELYKEFEKDFDLSFFQDKFVISYISRIEGRKNQKFLIDAYIKFRKETDYDTVLIIAGNSLKNEIYGYDERERLYFSIPDEERENILFYDFVDKNMYKLLCSVSNIAIMASTFENFPIAMMEYVYMGIPIMGSVYSGCKDYMRGHEEFTAFNPFDVNDLKEKILNFSNLSVDRQISIANQQYENLKILCNINDSLNKKLELYQKVCNERKKISSEETKLTIYNCDDLEKKIQRDQYCELLIVTGVYKENSCIKFMSENGYIFTNMNDEKIVVVGLESLIHRNLNDALVHDEMLIFRNIWLKDGKSLAENMNEYLEANSLDYVYIPYFSAKDVEMSSRENRYTELTNQLFRLSEKIDLEKERIDW